jgi:hypothetical protein
VIARASPILDFILFMFLTIGLSIAGHTFQDVYETRTIVESVTLCTHTHRSVQIARGNVRHFTRLGPAGARSARRRLAAERAPCRCGAG